MEAILNEIALRLNKLEEDMKRLDSLHRWIAERIAEPMPMEEATEVSDTLCTGGAGYAEQQSNGDIFIALPDGTTLTIGRWERSE